MEEGTPSSRLQAWRFVAATHKQHPCRVTHLRPEPEHVEHDCRHGNILQAHEEDQKAASHGGHRDCHLKQGGEGEGSPASTEEKMMRRLICTGTPLIYLAPASCSKQVTAWRARLVLGQTGWRQMVPAPLPLQQIHVRWAQLPHTHLFELEPRAEMQQ